MELNDKLNVVNEGINYYKGIEKTLQKALVLAEKTAEDTKEAAVKQARVIEQEARTKAQLIVADANNELQRLQQQIHQLVMQYDAYKAQFKHLAAAQCEFLESESFQLHIPDSVVQSNMENGEFHATEPDQPDEVEDKSEDDFEFYNLNEDD
jgi:cell division initiation protein